MPRSRTADEMVVLLESLWQCCLFMSFINSSTYFFKSSIIDICFELIPCWIPMCWITFVWRENLRSEWILNGVHVDLKCLSYHALHKIVQGSWASVNFFLLEGVSAWRIQSCREVGFLRDEILILQKKKKEEMRFCSPETLRGKEELFREILHLPKTLLHSKETGIGDSWLFMPFLKIPNHK